MREEGERTSIASVLGLLDGLGFPGVDARLGLAQVYQVLVLVLHALTKRTQLGDDLGRNGATSLLLGVLDLLEGLRLPLLDALLGLGDVDEAVLVLALVLQLGAQRVVLGLQVA